MTSNHATTEGDGATQALQEERPFIPYAEPGSAPEYLREILGRYQTRMGFVPNALRLYLHRPEIALVLWDLNDKVMRDPSSALDIKLKRKLGAYASRINGCRYCTTHHCAILQSPGGFGTEGWSMGDSDMQKLLSGSLEPADAIEAACMEFVDAASRDPTEVPESVLDALRKHLTPPQIVELAAVVGFWKMYNTIHDSLHIPIESHLLSRSQNVGF